MRIRVFQTIRLQWLAVTMLLLFVQTTITGGATAEVLNVPPESFTALFNGKDLTGWHTPPDVLANWFVEDGVLKSLGLVEHYRASLVTKKHYRDFILMLDFRMPTISDSGICFRRLIPEIQEFGDMEQFNLRSTGGMGHLESYYFIHNGVERGQRNGAGHKDLGICIEKKLT